MLPLLWCDGNATGAIIIDPDFFGEGLRASRSLAKVNPIDRSAVKPDQPDYTRTVRAKRQRMTLWNTSVDSADASRGSNRAYEGAAGWIACSTEAKVKNGPEIWMADPIGAEGIDSKINDGLRDGACHFVHMEGRADGERKIVRRNRTAGTRYARLLKRTIEKSSNLPELANAES